MVEAETQRSPSGFRSPTLHPSGAPSGAWRKGDTRGPMARYGPHRGTVVEPVPWLCGQPRGSVEPIHHEH